MSVRMVANAIDYSPYEGKAQMIHVVLADMADDEGVCWPSQATIARKSRSSVEYVRQVLAQMQADGVLEVLSQARGRGRSARYRLAPLAVTEPVEGSGFRGVVETPNSVVGQETVGLFDVEKAPTLSEKPPTPPSKEPPIEPQEQATASQLLPTSGSGNEADPFGRSLALVEEQPRTPRFGAIFASEWASAHGESPVRSLIARAGRDAKALVEKERRDPERVAEAVAYAAQMGHANVASAYGMLATQGTRVDPWGRPSTAGERLHDDAMGMLERAAAREAGRERKGIGA